MQQLIIYIAHIGKGAPKKMIQLFESFIEVCEEKQIENEKKRFLVVSHKSSDNSSGVYLTFDYYRQYVLGMTAYLITPIFNRLCEINIREHSDKLLVSSLRFVDFLFKFHRHTFSWKNLEISPELLEINRSPELKSFAVDLLNYLAKVHINTSSFSFDDYKFDNLIANEIFAITKTDEVFSALHSFSLDETLSLKEHYKDLLEKNLKKYKNSANTAQFIFPIASLQVVLGDLHYYDDELEDAEMYYESTVHTLRNLALKNKEDRNDETMTMEELYLFVRNMLKLGAVLEKRRQYDFAYLTYGELCKRIIRERNISITELKAGIVLRKLEGEDVFIKSHTVKEDAGSDKKERLDKEKKKYYDNVDTPPISLDEEEVDDSIATAKPLFFKNISPNTNDMLFKKMTFEGLKLLYLPFIAKLQILEKSHVGGITLNHLEQLDREFNFLTSVIDHPEANILEADFHSRVADVLYYKNSDLKQNKNTIIKNNCNKNNSCTACEYYRKALFILLNEGTLSEEKIKKTTPLELLEKSIENIKDNFNTKHCTVLARILSDWGNVFYSCDKRNNINDCYLDERRCCNTQKPLHDNLTNDNSFMMNCIKYIESESNEENRKNFLNKIKEQDYLFTKMEIAFAMYAVSLKAYTKTNLYKRSAYQINKMLQLFKTYEIYIKKDDLGRKEMDNLGRKAIRSLWYAGEDLNIFEVNKRKRDFDKQNIDGKISLKNILVDSEISRIRVLVKYLELKLGGVTTSKLKEYYNMYITSPYSINYSISARIYRLRLKSTVNYETLKMLFLASKVITKDTVVSILDTGLWHQHGMKKSVKKYINIISDKDICDVDNVMENIFDIKNEGDDKGILRVEIFERLVAESIFCLKESIRLAKTIGETYLFNHRFIGTMHDKLSFWVRLYEVYSSISKTEFSNKTEIDKYLKNYIGEEWNEKISGYYANQQALSHYFKCLETHAEGKAYHNMLEKMCYIKDDYNDRSDHFNIAEERYFILNGKIDERIENIKNRYKNSELYNMENYFHNITNALG